MQSNPLRKKCRLHLDYYSFAAMYYHFPSHFRNQQFNTVTFSMGKNNQLVNNSFEYATTIYLNFTLRPCRKQKYVSFLSLHCLEFQKAFFASSPLKKRSIKSSHLRAKGARAFCLAFALKNFLLFSIFTFDTGEASRWRVIENSTRWWGRAWGRQTAPSKYSPAARTEKRHQRRACLYV